MAIRLPKDTHVYRTRFGLQVAGDSRELLARLPDESVDLIVTSPPFALLRQKTYGNKAQHEYVSWLCEFGKAAQHALKDTGTKFYTPKVRPSGHDIADAFGRGNGGAIPSNLLQIPNTDSNSHYQRTCKALGRDRHPARYPEDLPRFFIKFLTDPGDLVVDIFSGSNTTGQVAEELNRKWLSIDENREYAALSAVRFMEGWSIEDTEAAVTAMEEGQVVSIRKSHQQTLFWE